MALKSIILVLACFLVATRAQISYNDDVDVVCSDTSGESYCTYTIDYDATEFTAAANGPTNNFVCARSGLPSLGLNNPFSGASFQDVSGAQGSIEAPCDCDTITWTIPGGPVVFNNPSQYQLNDCGVCVDTDDSDDITRCGAAETLCEEAGVCTAGVCVTESKCPPTGNVCVVSSCSLDPLVGCMQSSYCAGVMTGCDIEHHCLITSIGTPSCVCPAGHHTSSVSTDTTTTTTNSPASPDTSDDDSTDTSTSSPSSTTYGIIVDGSVVVIDSDNDSIGDEDASSVYSQAVRYEYNPTPRHKMSTTDIVLVSVLVPVFSAVLSAAFVMSSFGTTAPVQ